ARATAPMLSGLRGSTSTTRSRLFSLLLEIGVSLQAFLVELQQASRLFVADSLFAYRKLYILAELIQHHLRVVFNVIKNLAHCVAFYYGFENNVALVIQTYMNRVCIAEEIV